ncbi:kallikrein-1-like [Erinaceus europaeus]|uniref:Kallikrein-1-like n=1 Tax=Erinaceus europaeus TaxID=9365 RepID=A0ABM3X120_ERIEU|nr:kallikrein-1-like [Erinaceus europaeus]
MRVFKGISSELPDHLLLLETVSMWGLVLSLVLSLGAVPPTQSIAPQKCAELLRPWTALTRNFSDYACGGVLVHPQWVLSTAHCQPQWMSMYFVGLRSMWAGGPMKYQIFSKVTRFPHPQFKESLLSNHHHETKETYSHDLLLIRLPRPARLDSKKQVVALPSQEPQAGSRCYAYGWSFPGQVDFFHHFPTCLDVQLLPKAQCPVHRPVTDSLLCAGPMNDQRDFCLHEAGIPLICDGVLQGILTMDHIPCDSFTGKYLFTCVLENKKWIEDTIAQNT